MLIIEERARESQRGGVGESEGREGGQEYEEGFQEGTGGKHGIR